MFDGNKLKGKMAELGYTGKKLAELLGITPQSFYKKAKTGKFYIPEAQKIAELLDLQNPSEIFFAKHTTY